MPTCCGCGKEYTDFYNEGYLSGAHRIPYCRRCQDHTSLNVRQAEMRIRLERIYFIQCDNDGPIKIGMTANLSKRLECLQMANYHELKILATEGGGKIREKELHERFGHLRIRGEWFKSGNELLSYINEVRESEDSLDN